MKKIILIFFVSLFFWAAGAQNKIPSFGKIDKADLEMKDCDFDPGAEALVLLDIGEIQFSYIMNIGWQSESTYRMRIKILKPGAVNRGEIKIRYYTKNRYEEITNISGISFNLDANGNVEETRMDKQSVFDKPFDKEYADVSFALPNVRVGTVFEYKYKLQRKSFGYIPPWIFQQSIPVKYSAYNISIPESFRFIMQTIKRQEMEKKEGNSAADGTWYIMRNIPGLKDEPYSSAKNSYLQRIEFQLSTIQTANYYQEIRNTWPKLIDELLNDEDFGGALKKNIRRTDSLDAKLALTNSTKEKIRIVYNYVQNNMQWNNEYSRYSDGIKEAWEKRTGNITDINFILIRLLKDAGINAKPLLASTKDNGPVNAYYPFLNDFNCVLAYVEDGTETYTMNAADKYNPFNLVPYEVLFTNALIVEKNGDRLIALNSDKKYESNVFVICNVEGDGKISGQGTLSSSGYARNIRMSTYKKNKLNETLEDNAGITIKADSISVKNEKDELESFDQKIEFKGKLEASGEYFFLPYNLFTGLRKNLFIEEDRVMDIDFNFPKSYLVSGSYLVTDDYAVNSLPKNVTMIMPDTSIVLSRKTQHAGNIITFRFKLDFAAAGYSAESYPYIKEFFKKLYAILDEKIVLKKK
ncbi:MAG TPA: DUF3857 domain-containing protein [Ferruginibacter sp.]|nr:DUF3857 domain-containing protein [Ferruginibacter sp.]